MAKKPQHGADTKPPKPVQSKPAPKPVTLPKVKWTERDEPK